ncbi:MAG: YkvA family protein [Armatimonadota bacterium]
MNTTALRQQSPTLLDSVKRLGKEMREQVMPIIARIPAYGRLIYALVTHRELTAKQKAPILLALGYNALPLNLVPGFIPVLGELDDLLVLFWAIKRTLAVLSPEQASAMLSKVHVTPEQMESDEAIIRQALFVMPARGAKAVGRGALKVVTAGITAGTFVSYLAYFAAKGELGRRRNNRPYRN